MKRENLKGELLAEFLGTLLFIMLGCGVVANVLFAPRLNGFGIFKTGAGYGWDTIAFGWAMAVTIAVYVAGGVTGAHINPAVTLAAVVRRGFPLGKAIAYMIVQVAGAFCGAGLAYVIYRGNFIKDGYMNIFYTGAANDSYTLVNSFLVELIATAVLVLGIYAVVDIQYNIGMAANLWPVGVGFIVLMIGLCLGGPTGYAINPARDFGPRVFAALIGDKAAFSGAYWLLVPIIGPLVGGVLGAIIYDYCIAPNLPKKREELTEKESIN